MLLQILATLEVVDLAAEVLMEALQEQELRDKEIMEQMLDKPIHKMAQAEAALVELEDLQVVQIIQLQVLEVLD